MTDSTEEIGQPGPARTTLAQNDHMKTAYMRTKEELVVTPTPSENLILCDRMGQREKMNNVTDLIELARVVQQADSHTTAMVGGKLELITDQIMALQAQARQVLEQAQEDLKLSHAKCNFQRRAGTTYHLYEKVIPRTGATEQFFSMLSPADYSGSPPNTYLNSYRLEFDMSWTQVDRIEARDEKRKFNPVLLGLTDEHVANSSHASADNKSQLRLTMI